MLSLLRQQQSKYMRRNFASSVAHQSLDESNKFANQKQASVFSTHTLTYDTETKSRKNFDHLNNMIRIRERAATELKGTMNMDLLRDYTLLERH